MAEVQETATEAEVDRAVKEISPEQDVEQKSDINVELLKLFKNGR